MQNAQPQFIRFKRDLLAFGKKLNIYLITSACVLQQQQQEVLDNGKPKTLSDY